MAILLLAIVPIMVKYYTRNMTNHFNTLPFDLIQLCDITMFYLSFRDLSIVLKRYVLLASSLSKGIWQMTLKLQKNYRVRILFYVTIDVLRIIWLSSKFEILTYMQGILLGIKLWLIQEFHIHICDKCSMQHFWKKVEVKTESFICRVE